MSLHTFVRFEPAPGKDQQLRDELLGVLEPTRAEPGCLRIHLFESIRPPFVFYIHSEWRDEAAFDAHVQFPHMIRFLPIVRELVTHPVHGIRTQQIA
jgi:quinol monooxygenase YgiN